MESLKKLQHFINFRYEDHRRNLTINCTIFGYHRGDLQLLIVKDKFFTKRCLPGGFIKKSENLDEAATRIKAECTGINNLFLKQFKTFGNRGRNSQLGLVDLEKMFELTGGRILEDNWLLGETASVGYYAITDITHTKPKPDLFSSDCRWFPLNELPELGFDHHEMVKEALSTIKIHLYHYPVGKNLLPKKFTLKEIKLFYEIMSGKQLNATNFPNKLILMGLIVKLDEKKSIGAHRSPTFYKFNDEVYEKALKEGLVVV
jgi:8-oxo-dGTP diphosphatase